MKIKKYISILIVVVLLFAKAPPVMAFEIPSASTPPPAPEITVEEPSLPTAPETPSAPETPTAPTLEEALAPDPTPTATEEQTSGEDQNADSQSQETTTQDQEQTGINDSGNVGDTSIDTGDANTTGAITTLGNTNTNNLGVGGDENSVGLVNSGNGTDSTNNGSVSLSGNNNTFQDNSAIVGNNLNQSSTSGNNASDNNVGNTMINTGDANSSATVITGVNTNVDGIMVSQFNIADDQIGDIILDFGAGCILGCSQEDSILAQNSGNGSDSTNNAAVNDTSNTNTFQTNDASVETNLTLDSDSGSNSTSANTGGDSTIETGDANVAANLLTFANNNLSGNVVFGVVNIFGDLTGDILFPESALSCSTCGGDVTVANAENGSDSTNNATVNQTNSDSTFQYNDAYIENNLLLATTTGGNEASGNTNGNSTIETGDTDVIAQVLNVANMNLIGGDIWLVLVNEAGQWIGSILGAADGANYAGSAGTEFVIDENGEITAINSGNGSGSTNNASVNQSNNNTIAQTNNAVITNNLNLSANTGGNTASNNTGGDSTITTGDAKIVANIVNFVNNNIIGNGKLFVTVVNVFGSWIGDFVTPGSNKNKPAAEQNNNQTANAATQPSSNSQSNNNVGGSNFNQSNNNSSSSNNSVSNNPVSIPASNVSLNPQTNSSGGSNQQVIVAGVSSGTTFNIISEDPTYKDSKNKGIRINLAWLLILIPTGLTYVIIKRKLNALKFLPRKTR